MWKACECSTRAIVAVLDCATEERTAMAKKRETPDSAPSDGGKPETPETSAAPRISVQLTSDGSIAWDRIRDTTKAQLRKALSDPNTGKQLGLADGSAAAQLDMFDPSLCGVLYDSLSTALVGLARWRGGYTDEQAAVLRFNADEKKALGEPTARVLNKYGASFGKYQDEIALGLLLTTIITGKVTALRKAAVVIEMVRRDDGNTSETPATGA